MEASALEDGAESTPLVERPVAWVLATALLLTVGFVALILALVQVVIWMRPDADIRNFQTAVAIYARVVVIKALWPHVIVTTIAYASMERLTPIGGWSHARQCAAFIALALAVATLITAVVLPSEAFGLAGVRTGSAFNFIATIVEISFGTTAAATVARWTMNRLTHR